MSRLRLLTAGLATAGLAAAAVVVLAPPGAGQVTPAMTISPTSGPPGTQITVTGNPGQCPPDPAFGQHQAEGELQPSGGGTALATYSVNTDTNTGNWTATVTVPATAAPGDYQVTGDCTQGGGTQFSYTAQTFTVTQPATTTTSTTAATTTTTTTTQPPSAPAAQAVTAQPRFTG